MLNSPLQVVAGLGQVVHWLMKPKTPGLPLPAGGQGCPKTGRAEISTKPAISTVKPINRFIAHNLPFKGFSFAVFRMT
jgi:hypothetical protein